MHEVVNDGMGEKRITPKFITYLLASLLQKGEPALVPSLTSAVTLIDQNGSVTSSHSSCLFHQNFTDHLLGSKFKFYPQLSKIFLFIVKCTCLTHSLINIHMHTHTHTHQHNLRATLGMVFDKQITRAYINGPSIARKERRPDRGISYKRNGGGGFDVAGSISYPTISS